MLSAFIIIEPLPVDVGRSRERGLGVLKLMTDWFVGPIGKMPSVGLIMTFGALAAILFWPRKLLSKEPILEGDTVGMNDFRDRYTPPTFGRRTATTSEQAGPIGDAASQAIDLLSVHSFDWYFAHYGFEGQWRQAHQQLEEAGLRRLAAVMFRAGECYDRYIAEVFTPADGEPSPEDEKAYLAEVKGIYREWRETAGI